MIRLVDAQRQHPVYTGPKILGGESRRISRAFEELTDSPQHRVRGVTVHMVGTQLVGALEAQLVETRIRPDPSSGSRMRYRAAVLAAAAPDRLLRPPPRRTTRRCS